MLYYYFYQGTSFTALDPTAFSGVQWLSLSWGWHKLPLKGVLYMKTTLARTNQGRQRTCWLCIHGLVWLGCRNAVMRHDFEIPTCSDSQKFGIICSITLLVFRMESDTIPCWRVSSDEGMVYVILGKILQVAGHASLFAFASYGK